jgi:hypothetical protein
MGAQHTTISRRAFAKMLGLASDNSVRKAIESGRLKRCLVDGKIDPQIGVDEWNANTNPSQQRTVTPLTDAAANLGRTPTAPAAPPPTAPPPTVARLADERGKSVADRYILPDGSDPHAKKTPKPRKTVSVDDESEDEDGDERKMAEINRSIALAKEEDAYLELALKKGELVPRSQTLAFAQTLGRLYRDQTLLLADQYAPSIAAALNVDEHLCHQVIDEHLRKHFEASIAKIKTEIVITGETPDVEEAVK